jgi:hypothetical protein
MQPPLGLFALVREARNLGVDLCLPCLRMLDASKILGDLTFDGIDVG